MLRAAGRSTLNTTNVTIKLSLFLLLHCICLPLSAQEFAADYVLEVQQTGNLKTYNGVYPGPLIRTRAGDMLDIELVNSLPVLNDDCTSNMNRAHGLNTTNLHTHGLHVSPSFDSSGKYYADNVFVSLVPEGQIVECDSADQVDDSSHAAGHSMMMDYQWGRAQYRFELPDDHMSGTFWYHAHKHGSTAKQVGDGLAGPMIVEDPPGYMPDYIAEANERIFVIGNKGLYLANEAGGGVLNPTVKIAPGEVQRWRIINAMGDGQQYRLPYLNLDGLEVYLIAFDGLTLEKRVPIDTDNLDKPWLNPAALASGNRLDLIVHAPADYKTKARSEEVPRQSLLSTLLGNKSIVSAFEIVVDVSGEAVDMVWSTESELPGPNLSAIEESADAKRTVAFTRGDTIDNVSFDGQVSQTMKLNSTEEWTVTNETGMLHVYHIHVNPFFVTHLNGEQLPEDSPLRRWQDTLGVPVRSDGSIGSVQFLSRFENFSGQFVIHCHVLAHEDRGMMQIVEVVE